MESTLKIILLTFFLFVLQNAFCQNANVFCKAVNNSNFRKAERIVIKVIKKNRKGQTYFNGEGSGYQINLTASLDSIINWLKKRDCVEDAYWDKNQLKPAIYPGWATIGIKLRTNKGIIEKCFFIQKGTTGQVNILGWRPKLFKSRQELVYKRMFNCENFIKLQK
jgi:hypothetical protein